MTADAGRHDGRLWRRTGPPLPGPWNRRRLPFASAYPRSSLPAHTLTHTRYLPRLSLSCAGTLLALLLLLSPPVISSMGDGGCAVLSSRHPLAEFCNSEPRRRGPLKRKHRNWEAELVLARVKEHSENASPHDHRSSSWPPVLVNDMELGSFLQVGDIAAEQNDKQGRRQHSRWDVRADGMADKYSSLHGGAACEPKTIDSEVAGSLQEQVGTVTEVLSKEHANESGSKKVRVVNDDCANESVSKKARVADDDCEQQKSCSKNRHYRHEHSSMITEVTCIDSSRSGNAECVSLSSQETITKSFTSGNDGSSARKTDSIVKCDTLCQSEDRASLNSPTESRRGTNPPYSSIESKLQSYEYFSEYSLDDPRQGGRSRNLQTGVLHYNRRSKKEKKSRQSENESTPSVSKAGSRVVDPCTTVEGSRLGVSSSDSYISRDEPTLGHKEKGSTGHHRKEKSPCESRLSSRQEKYGDRDKERGSGGHHRRERSPSENRVSSRQEKSGDYRRHDHVNNQEKFREYRRNDCIDNHCQTERDSHSSGNHRREASPAETRRASKQEELSFQRTMDSDGSTFRSLLSEKSRLGSLGKDAVSGTGDYPTATENSCGEFGAADVKQQLEESSVDAKDSVPNPEEHPGHCQAQFAFASEEELWQEELDVPMDLSPAPAEDNASSSHVTSVETIDPGFIEHFVAADNSFHEDPDGRGWIYLDTEGVTQGPSSLFILKSFMRAGRLQPDHMVQLDGTNMWLTLEHAGLTQDSLGETFMLQTSSSVIVQGASHLCSTHLAGDNTVPVFLSSVCEFSEDLNIDNRVDRLMQGFTLLPGKEDEVIVEALNQALRQNRPGDELELEDEDMLKSTYHQVHSFDGVCERDYYTEASNSNEVVTSMSGSLDDSVSQSSFQSSRMWTCRGGDWKLMFEIDASAKAIPGSGRPEKLVLNRGKPLCTRQCGRLPDPRRGSVLYGVTNSRRLELPSWAYRYWEVMGEYCSSTAEKSLNAVPATFLSTPRSQVATPKDFSFTEASKKPKLDKVTSLSDQKLDESSTISLCEVASTQCQVPFVAVESCQKEEARRSSLGSQDLECSNIQLERQEAELVAPDKVTEKSVKSVRQVPQRSDLMLETGEWFYQDGNGQEVGPYTFLQLQTRVRDGLLYEGSSVYRKDDETWVPLFANKSKERLSFNLAGHTFEEDGKQALVRKEQRVILDFHQLYPQFIGFMCGRLHEHVMKSYRTRDFAAMVDEGSKSCFGDKRLSLSSSEQKDGATGRMRSLLEVEDGRTAFGVESEGWNMIDRRILMKIFRYLERDLKSLVLASLTCKSWRAVLSHYKRETTHFDFSSLGSLCSDDIFRSFTEHAQNVSTVSLRGCTMLTPSAVKAFLQGCRSVESVDAKGCEQLKELIHQFSLSRPQPGGSESYYKLKDLKSVGDRKGTSLGRHSLFLDDWKGKKLNFSNDHVDGVTEPMDCDIPPYLQLNVESSHGVAPTDYKRQKLFSTGNLIKVGADSYYSKSSYHDGRDKEHFDRKHKQSSIFSSRVSEAIAHISFEGESFEKDMSLVLQCVKDLKIPFNKEVASVRCRVELAKVEDKLRRGSYAETSIGLRAFKSDLFDVARKLFRLKEFDAGNDIFTITFRLTKQLLHEWKGRDTSDSKPFKRKFEQLKSSSSLSSRKRGIGNAIREQVIGKRRKSHDESSEEDESEYNYASKSEASGTDEEDDLLSQDEKDEVSAESDSEVETESEGEGKVVGEKEPLSEDETDSRIWGARMTKASMVPPETRKYELIEEYVIVADADEVEKRMGVNLPEDYDKMMQAQEDRGIEYSHLEMPELREFKPRKHVYEEVLEQEVYGIDPYTHNLLIDSMPTSRPDFPDVRRHQVIEEDILKSLNHEVRQFTGTGKAPTKYPLESAVNRALEECRDPSKKSFIAALAKNMRSRKDSYMKDTYLAYRKGLGVVCNHDSGFDKDEFIVEFFGEVYPAWRWFEKQDAIRFFQKKDKDPAPEFYNIFLERPKGDASGYDLVVVDAMHKANYASRICHSCRPNCEARVTAVNGRYQIGVYTLRPVEFGEELTFDYNSITESKEEHEKSVCLCGSHVCRGSYLNLAGAETFQEIMKEDHSLLHRHDLLLHACINGSATPEDWDILKQAGLGSCLLDGLPGWTIKYAAGVVRFVNEEKKFLPREILKNILGERKLERAGESEAFEAEIQADGVFNTRLQNLAITLDKVRYVFKRLYGNPALAPPPLKMLKPMEVVSLIWKHENSVVADLLHGMSQHISKEDLLDFKRRVREHEPSQIGNIEKNLQQSLIWLRDELCKAPITCASRHDGAADLIHMYAYTKLFFTCQDYPTFESPPLTISPLDLGPKHAHKLGAASSMEWTKTYSKDYVLGQLIFWYEPNVAEPGASLAKASKGCLSLPDPISCYAKSSQQRLVYGSMDRLRMLRRM
ncbi:hypothetical protein GOP47_0024851, partial [Adiantum capillus-veneris]